MASLPPRQDPQRRASQPEDSSAASSQHEQPTRRSSHGSSSTTSAVLLNPDRLSSSSHSAAGGPSQQTPQTPAAAAQASPSTAGPATEDNEPRRCWICFNDETEDDENSSEWRSPCPCVLVAHEKCLLDWIADMEAPSGRRAAGARKDKILCPQCKSEIKLQRPRSLVVDTVRFVERATGMLLLPGVLGFAATATLATLSIIGQSHVYQIFGAEDAVQILGPLYRFRRAGNMLNVTEFMEHWRLHLGLPLIPTMLMASRTRFADSFLPFIPLIFFVSSGRPQDEMLQLTWPPSAAFTVATLPYIRGIYNAYYDRVWLPREQRWLKEIQPRAGADNDAADLEIQIGDMGGRIEEIGDEDDIDDEVLEVEIDMDIFADWMNGGDDNNALRNRNPPAPVVRNPDRFDRPPFGVDPIPPPPEELEQHDGHDNGDDNDMPPLEAIPGPRPPINPAGELNAAAAAAPAPAIPIDAPRRGNRIRERRDVTAFSTLSLADTILGALVFPSIAAAVGEVLKFALPKSWTTPPSFGPLARKPTGFLQTKWGRSILGGCLFVGVKDAVMLYVRWKMASSHRNRRVLNYDGKGVRNRGNRNGTRERAGARV